MSPLEFWSHRDRVATVHGQMAGGQIWRLLRGRPELHLLVRHWKFAAVQVLLTYSAFY